MEVEGVTGHQDCIIDGVVVDCKSASGVGFDKFKHNKLAEDDPFGYVAQISAYAEANGIMKQLFCYQQINRRYVLPNYIIWI